MEKERNSWITDKPLYDHSISFDKNKLTSFMKELVDELESYDKIGDWFNYDIKFEILESEGKNCIINGRLTEEDYNILMKKYGWYV